MTKRLAVAIGLALALAIITPAGAQQSIEQRIGGQIGALVIQNSALSLQIEQLQARIKALEDKYEPKTPDNK